jgi:NAD-dependent dihydropyrimidine dehydrogenase PreA subunit
MPQPRIAIDYQVCDPSSCEEGICASAQVCQRKVLRQEKPGELPDIYPNLCLGCVDCISVCLKKALRIMS